MPWTSQVFHAVYRIKNYMLFVVATVWVHRTPAGGIERISGDPRQEDLVYRTARVVA